MSCSLLKWDKVYKVYLQCMAHHINKLIVRLKKINPISQSYHAHLFFGVRLILQNSRFEFFFACLIFFPFFFMNLLVKIYMKRYHRHNETPWTTDFFISVLCLVSCSSKIKFHISKLWLTQIWHACCSEKQTNKQTKKKTETNKQTKKCI